MSDPTQPPAPEPREPGPQVPEPQIPTPEEIPNPPAPDVVAPPVHDIPGESAEAGPAVPAPPPPAPPAPPAPAPAPIADSAPAQWPAATAYAVAPAPAPAAATSTGSQTSSNAIIALILAVGSWAICPLILSIIALVFANMAGKEIAASGGRIQGAGLNTAAKIVAWINIGVVAAAIIIGIFVVILVAIAGSTT